MGDLVVADADVPFDTRSAEGYRHELWLVPKPLLDPYLPAGGGPLSAPLSGRHGVEALAAGYLQTLTRNWDDFSDASMAAVTDTLCRLIGIACGTAVAEQPDAVRRGRLIEARQHIDRHLNAPELSPASVAAALGISVRALHLLFEPTGTSFARYALQRRLQERRAVLLANPTRPVIDVAFAWGFGSLSSFYRAFQAAFGMSPGDAREAALAGSRW